jgi:cytochrome P450
VHPPKTPFAASENVELSDLAFWARPAKEREAAFARMRGLESPAYFREPLVTGFPRGPGYYALVKHADIAEVSRRPQDFGSSAGSTNIVDLPREFNEFFGSMINMDNPEHAKLRRIVSRAFSRSMAPVFEAASNETARQIVDGVVSGGSGEFVRDVAAKMPIIVLSGLMGIPSEDYDFIFDRSNTIVGVFDPDYVPQTGQSMQVLLKASNELAEYINRLSAERLKNPTDDLITRLVRAQIDGEQLTRQELASFFVLLVVAGMETTRNAISRALVLLTENPGQRRLLRADFDKYAGGAAEEILRVTTPINWMRRTTMRDCEMNGLRFRKGDKVLLFYYSGNRDEQVFEDPNRFDITRDPNPHLSFGSVGPHFCLGAHLARLELVAILRELFDRLPEIRSVGEPKRLESNFIEGIKYLKYEF